jgi:flagellar basal body-associated protein FliL
MRHYKQICIDDNNNNDDKNVKAKSATIMIIVMVMMVIMMMWMVMHITMISTIAYIVSFDVPDSIISYTNSHIGSYDNVTGGVTAYHC